MRMRNLFFGMLACVAFTACSSDDAEVIEGGSGTFKGDVAYMNIILADASGTRATSPEAGENTSPFEYGTKGEQAVNDAHFYFYDADGVFVSEAEVWKGGTPSDKEPNENIEFRAKTTVVLKGLTGKSYPKYLVTVLNKSADFTPGTTLEDMEKKIAAGDTVGNITVSKTEGKGDAAKEVKYFTMSTTSFAGQKASDGTTDLKYFVTEVTEGNFNEGQPASDTDAPNPVTVYVERLAAKVELNVADELNKKAEQIGTGDDAKYYYPITVTSAGDGNDEEADMGVEDLYVNILGWKLNATARDSYMMKNIDEKWTSTQLGFAWNDPTNFRSYWGKAHVYGNNTFPIGDASGYYDSYTGLLNYFNMESTVASPLLTLKDPAYCAENTNTSDIVSANPRKALTSILVKAEIGRIVETGGVKSFEALDMVRYNGVLFREDHFLKYVLNNLQKASDLTAYYESGTDASGKKTYKQIDETFVELKNLSDGKVAVVLKAETPKAITDAAGNALSAEAKTKLAEDMAKASAGATGYKGGLMYYNIPIEHLNPTSNTEETKDGVTTVKIPEAKYGVVRNHVYKVTINQLENPGKGIFDPEEVIVPKDEDEKFYYVGAQINILSWKIVNQGVSL